MINFIRRLFWRPMSSAPLDGRDIVLFTTCHGEVEARFAPGEWSEHHEYGREYDGAVWVCADDAFQIEVEERPEGFHHGTAIAWRPKTPPPLWAPKGQNK